MSKFRAIYSAVVSGMRKSVNQDLPKKIGQYAADSMEQRVRRGFGADDNRNAVRFPKLNNKTIKRRKTKRLDSDTAPAKSNFTESGDTLRSIDYVKTKKGVSVGVGRDQESKKKIQNNPQFKVIGVTKNEIAEITDIIVDNLVDNINLALRKIK